MGYSALFIDFDRTLHDFEATNRRALTSSLQQVLQPDPASLPALVAGYVESAQSLYDLYESGRLTLEEMHRARMARALRSGALPEDPPVLDALVGAHQKAFVDALVMFPDARDVLVRLAQTYPLFLLSNGPEGVQRARVRSSGVEGYFQDVIISGEVGCAKPHPRYFQLALQRAGAMASEVLMVGDSPRHDIEGARRCGIEALWLNRHAEPWPLESPPPPQVCTLQGLVAWLEDRS